MALVPRPAKSVQQGQYVLSSPRPQAVLRPLRQPQYDSELVGSAGSGVSQVLFFQKPQGQTSGNSSATAVTKTEVHTSLTAASQLGVPMEFDLYGFRLRVWSAVGNAQSSMANYGLTAAQGSALATVLRQINGEGVFQFLFGTARPWLTVPCAFIPTGLGESVQAAGTGDSGNDSTIFAQNGAPSNQDFYNFTIRRRPLRIRSGENFSAKIIFPSQTFDPSIGIWLQVQLVGITYSAL